MADGTVVKSFELEAGTSIANVELPAGTYDVRRTAEPVGVRHDVPVAVTKDGWVYSYGCN